MGNKKDYVYAPVSNIADLTVKLSRVGELKARIAGIQAEKDRQEAELNQNFSRQLDPLETELLGLNRGLAIFCDEHRKQIEQSCMVVASGKTSDLGTGQICWESNGRGRVSFLLKIDQILKNIKARRLGRKLIRVTESPDKEAMLANPELAEKVKGIQIVKEDILQIKMADLPTDSYNSDDLRDIRRNVEKLKKVQEKTKAQVA